jgi:transposase-like protein
MHVWERQSGESEQAHAAFLLYRDMPKGERSVARVGQECGKNPSLLERWSAAWQWVQRAAAWDEEQLRVADAATLEAIRATNKAIHEACVMSRNKAVAALKNKNYEEMSIQELLLVFDTVNKHDWIALGVADGRHGPNGGKGKGQSAQPPQFFKIYEAVDVSKI